MAPLPVPLKTTRDVVHIRRPCRAAGEILKRIAPIILVGRSTGDINLFAERFIRELRVDPALAGFDGFPASVCTAVNHVAAHGVPGDYRLEDGDLVTVDITVGSGGWFGDAAWTYIAGTPTREDRRLVEAAWRASLAGVAMLKAGNRFGDVADAVQRVARSYGYHVLDMCAGHGIGQAIHEEPLLPFVGQAGSGMPVVPGMVLTVEPVLATCPSEAAKMENNVLMLPEGNRSAQFEHTVAVFSNRTEVLTLPENSLKADLRKPPF